MKIELSLHVAVLGCLLFFVFPHEVRAAPSDIILSEISIAGTGANDEFIELYNTGDAPFDLSGMQLRRRVENDDGDPIKSLRVFPKNSLIPAHGYFLWANSQGIFAAPLADTETSSSALAPDNSIGLFTKSGADGTLIESIAWGKGSPFVPDAQTFPNLEKNKSLTRNLTTLVWSITGDMTPTNSSGIVWNPPLPDPIPEPDPTPPPVPSTTLVRFNEILANPVGDDGAGEFIELYNEDTADADISGFIIRDASKTGAYTFPSGTLIHGQAYFILERSVSKISLNNSNETLSLSDATDALIDSMTYQKTKDGVSLNYTATGWRGGTPTPGTINRLNTLPETKEKVPKKGYRGVPLSFDARGRDTDGGTLKYVWNFGDNHKSYKEKTTHTYEKNGAYQVTLTTTDGSDDVTETFTITIESYPEPKIRITSFVPNPAGKDTEGEYLILENRGKKSVDLKGFGIATGWKKLSNHPVRESFVIAPKSEAKLTREFSLFTLPNQKGKVELRTPSGQVLQKIKYKLEGNAREDAVYHKEKGQRWGWQTSAPEEETDSTPQEQIPDETIEDAPSAPTLPEGKIEADAQEVLGATTTAEDIPNRNYLALLNYGTRVSLPDSIDLSFPEPAPASAPRREHYAVTFTKAILGSVNAALNTIQNDSWIGQPL